MINDDRDNELWAHAIKSMNDVLQKFETAKAAVEVEKPGNEAIHRARYVELSAEFNLSADWYDRWCALSNAHLLGENTRGRDGLREEADRVAMQVLVAHSRRVAQRGKPGGDDLKYVDLDGSPPDLLNSTILVSIFGTKEWVSPSILAKVMKRQGLDGIRVFIELARGEHNGCAEVPIQTPFSDLAKNPLFVDVALSTLVPLVNIETVLPVQNTQASEARENDTFLSRITLRSKDQVLSTLPAQEIKRRIQETQQSFYASLNLDSMS